MKPRRLKRRASAKAGDGGKICRAAKIRKGRVKRTQQANHKDTAKNEIAQEHPPAAKPEGGPARQDGGSETGGRRNPA